jgi:beta-glucanase (GH16 family)
MLQLVVSLLFIVVFNDVCLVVAWNLANFTFNPVDNYELVFQDEFENVGPVKAIINGKPAYAPNPKNWGYITGLNVDGGLRNFTDSIYNSYVQLMIVALKEGLTSAMLTSKDLQELTFGTWAAKIRLPYGQGMWPVWWLLRNEEKYKLWWPTVGEIDILEMIGSRTGTSTDGTNQNAFGTVHWNNLSNSMNPVNNKALAYAWSPPDGSILHNNSLVYWSEWNSTHIRIGVNEFTYSVIDTTNLKDSINPVWAFRGMWPYYMILNIGIGGPWPGPPDDTTVWPQQMIVDWVRVYQEKNPIVSK